MGFLLERSLVWALDVERGLPFYLQPGFNEEWDCGRTILHVAEPSWNLHLRRALNDWELEDMTLLMDCSVNSEGKDIVEVDSRLCLGTPDGIFSVSSSYSLMSMPENSFRLVELIWNPRLPSKAGFLLWLVYWGKLLTIDNLMCRGLQMVNRCFLCLSCCEMMNNLFLHCPVTFYILSFFIFILET